MADSCAVKISNQWQLTASPAEVNPFGAGAEDVGSSKPCTTARDYEPNGRPSTRMANVIT